MSFQATEDTRTSVEYYEGLDAFRPVSIYGVVLFHFALICNSASSPLWLIRLRDCCLPVFVMTSFFLLMRSLMRDPERSYRGFLTKRFLRIEVPFLIWTILYWLGWHVLPQLLTNREFKQPPSTLLLSGFAHLWFLQFIFLASVILYPLLGFIARRKNLRPLCPILCFTAALLYELLLKPLVQHHIQSKWMLHGDSNLQTFLLQSNNHVQYIPFSVGIACFAERVTALYEQRAFRLLSLLIVGAAVSLHLATDAPHYLTTDAPHFSKSLYSLAVFVALLQPWSGALGDGLRSIAAYSYPVYILHLFIARRLIGLTSRAGLEFTDAFIVLGSSVAFLVSLSGAVLVRKYLPYDWLLPLNPIRPKVKLSS